MDKVKQTADTAHEAVLAGVGAYDSTREKAADTFDQLYVSAAQLVNELLEKGESVEAKLLAKLEVSKMFKEKFDSLKAKLGFGNNNLDQQLDTLNQRVDGLIDVVVKLAQQKAAEQKAVEQKAPAKTTAKAKPRAKTAAKAKTSKSSATAATKAATAAAKPTSKAKATKAPAKAAAKPASKAKATKPAAKKTSKTAEKPVAKASDKAADKTPAAKAESKDTANKTD